MVPLGLLGSGEAGEIMEIRENEASSQTSCRRHRHMKQGSTRIADMGVRVGKTVKMLSNEGRGPLLVRIDETRIAMARGVAMRILVRRGEE
jgi:ferrous iron transport protein A